MVPLREKIRDGVSALPLLVEMGRLGDAPAPEQVVDLALRHKVIRPLQDRSEFLGLAARVAELRPRALLEIGTWRGGTLFMLARLAAPDAVIISIDLPESRMAHLYRVAQAPLFHRFARGRQAVHLLRRDSRAKSTIEMVSRILNGRPLDLLFIDGDHRYESVKADFDTYSRFVRPGGLVAFHDIANEPPVDVPRLWNELKPRFAHTEIIQQRGPRAMGIGVLTMSANAPAPERPLM